MIHSNMENGKLQLKLSRKKLTIIIKKGKL